MRICGELYAPAQTITSPTGRDRLLTATPPKDRADAACAIHDESLDGRVDEDREVGARHCRWQVADGGAAARAVALRNLIKAETLLVASIEVGVQWQANGGASRDERKTEAIRALRIHR